VGRCERCGAERRQKAMRTYPRGGGYVTVCGLCLDDLVRRLDGTADDPSPKPQVRIVPCLSPQERGG